MLQTEKAMLDIQIDHRNNDQGSSAVHASTHNETRRPIPDHARTAGLGHSGLSQNDYGRRHTKMRIPGVLKRNRFSAGSWFGITPAAHKHINPYDRGILASSRSCRDNAGPMEEFSNHSFMSRVFVCLSCLLAAALYAALRTARLRMQVNEGKGSRRSSRRCLLG